MTPSTVTTRFTILFDPPFWVGVYEIEHDARLWVGRWVFGSEPSGEEVHQFALRSLGELRARMTFSAPADVRPRQAVNYKRMQREIRRAAREEEIGTKSQEALKQQHAEGKVERKKLTRAEREAEKDYKRAVAREKARARHKGRR